MSVNYQHITDDEHKFSKRIPYRKTDKFRTNIKRLPPENAVPISANFIVSVCDAFRLKGKSPLGIVYKEPTDKELMDWLSTQSGYIQSMYEFDGAPFILEDYQEKWIEDDSKYRWAGKSRRVGLSLSEAAKRLAKATLINVNYNVTFISYTLEEAINKIDYARALYDTAPTKYKKRKMRDRRQSLEFRDPTKNTITKLLSHAQRAPRGGGGAIILDEFAHFQWAFKILEAALACILTGGGDLTMISTPLGEGDPFHQIGVEIEKYKYYSRHYVYWWDCRWLCNNVPEARKIAPSLPTEERVAKYGTNELKKLFNAFIDIESFQQEMEIKFLSDSYMYLPRSLVQQILYPYSSQQYIDESGNVVKFDPNAFDEDVEAGINIASKSWLDNNGNVQPSAYPIVGLYADEPRIKFYKCNKLEELKDQVMRNLISPYLIAGYDVGRSGHTSELRIFEEVEISNTTSIMIERYSQCLSNTPLPDQERFLFELLNDFPFLRLAIDATGLGLSSAEGLVSNFGSRVYARIFTVPWKRDAMKTLKSRMQKFVIAIAEDRVTIEHLLSIRRTVSKSNMDELFLVDKNKKHHGDIAWAIALASDIAAPVEHLQGRIPSNILTHGPLQFQNTKLSVMINKLLGGKYKGGVVKSGDSINDIIKSGNRIVRPIQLNSKIGRIPMPDSLLGLPPPTFLL